MVYQHGLRLTLVKLYICEFCKGIFYGYKIHWANKTGFYLREKEDWIRLCAKCHRNYDKEQEFKRLHSHF